MYRGTADEHEDDPTVRIAVKNLTRAAALLAIRAKRAAGAGRAIVQDPVCTANGTYVVLADLFIEKPAGDYYWEVDLNPLTTLNAGYSTNPTGLTAYCLFHAYWDGFAVSRDENVLVTSNSTAFFTIADLVEFAIAYSGTEFSSFLTDLSFGGTINVTNQVPILENLANELLVGVFTASSATGTGTETGVPIEDPQTQANALYVIYKAVSPDTATLKVKQSAGNAIVVMAIS